MKNPLEETIYASRTEARQEDIRGEYFRDQTAIIHSMPFRRLKHKTQVFFSPENDHVCTRIEHVIHVATIGATICKGLNKNGNWDLNEEMAFAIGLGHDLGHAPFGHAGETALNKKFVDLKFKHEMNSYRVVQYLANSGSGLNLTYGVKDGIINHNGEEFKQSIKPSKTINDLDNISDRTHVASSYEGVIIRYSDIIAYLGRDIEDAILAGFINKCDLPIEIKDDIGESNGEIINNLILDLIDNSKNSDAIGFSDRVFKKIQTLKKFNYEKIYKNPIINSYKDKCMKIIEELFDYFTNLYEKINDNYGYGCFITDVEKQFGAYLKKMGVFYNNKKTSSEQIVCDYISGMTDNYALKAYQSIKIPIPIKFK